MRNNQVNFLKYTLAVLTACFLMTALSGDAHALITGQLIGTVVDEDGNPKGGFTLEFTPTDQSKNSVKRKVKVNKDGQFKQPFFPTGLFKFKSLDPELFISHVKLVVQDPSGMEIDSVEGAAHPVDGFPAIQVGGGMKVYLDLVVVNTEKQKELVQKVSLSEASGDLKKVMRKMENNELEAALIEVDKVLEKKPELGAAYYLKGQALIKLKRYEEAIACFDNTQKFDKEQPGVPGNRALAQLGFGEKLDESGKKEEAAIQYQKAVENFDIELESTPDNMAFMTSRAAALERMGDEERFLVALQEIVEIDPSHVQARLRLADFLTKAGKGNEALALLDAMPSDDPGLASTLFNVAVKFYNDGQLDSAVMAVEKALDVDPDMAAGYRLMGRAKMSLGDKPGAIEALTRFLDLAPEDPSAETEKKLIEALKAE